MYHADEDELLVVRKALGKKRFEKLFGHPSADIPLLMSLVSNYFKTLPEPKESLEERVERLEDEIRRLKKELSPSIRRTPTRADLIYEKFREELEKEHFGRIVAIDTDSESVVGIGNTVLEAYHEASKKSSKTKFSYKRVGYPYVYRL